MLWGAAQSLEETERLVTEAQGLPPPFPPLSTLPDMNFGDSAIDGIMVRPRDSATAPGCAGIGQLLLGTA